MYDYRMPFDALPKGILDKFITLDYPKYSKEVIASCSKYSYGDPSAQSPLAALVNANNFMKKELSNVSRRDCAGALAKLHFSRDKKKPLDIQNEAFQNLRCTIFEVR